MEGWSPRAYGTSGYRNQSIDLIMTLTWNISQVTFRSAMNQRLQWNAISSSNFTADAMFRLREMHSVIVILILLCNHPIFSYQTLWYNAQVWPAFIFFFINIYIHAMLTEIPHRITCYCLDKSYQCMPSETQRYECLLWQPNLQATSVFIATSRL